MIWLKGPITLFNSSQNNTTKCTLDGKRHKQVPSQQSSCSVWGPEGENVVCGLSVAKGEGHFLLAWIGRDRGLGVVGHQQHGGMWGTPKL